MQLAVQHMHICKYANRCKSLIKTGVTKADLKDLRPKILRELRPLEN